MPRERAHVTKRVSRRVRMDQKIDMIEGLKTNWDRINKAYQTLSFALDTPAKKQRKEEFEEQIERDIERLTKRVARRVDIRMGQVLLEEVVQLVILRAHAALAAMDSVSISLNGTCQTASMADSIDRQREWQAASLADTIHDIQHQWQGFKG